MARIMIFDERKGSLLQKIAAWIGKRQYGGYLPGIFRIMLADLNVGRPAGAIYTHLHLRKNSPFTRLQREMVATVVNGVIGGAP